MYLKSENCLIVYSVTIVIQKVEMMHKKRALDFRALFFYVFLTTSSQTSFLEGSHKQLYSHLQMLQDC